MCLEVIVLRLQLIKLQRLCLAAVLLTLPFLTVSFPNITVNLYKIMNLCFLDKLAAFIMPVGLTLGLITQLCYHDFWVDFKIVKKYLIFSWCAISLCELIGISIFDTSHVPIYQHLFLFIIMELLKIVGIQLDPAFMRLFSYWLDMSYETFIYLVWTLGAAYWVYCLYYHDSKNLITTIISTGWICFAFIAAYALVEIAYFEGSGWARDILITCNPYLHRVGDGYGWWPPLLWGDKIQRMRSIFAEPSYMGIYFAFLMPFLWVKVFKSSIKFNSPKNFKYLLWLLPIFFSFMMMFLTRSRTAYGITLLQLSLLTVLILWSRRKEYYAVLGKLVICCCLAALTAGNITDINISGINDLNNGSNNSRLGYIVATTKIGLAHPVFGTGRELFNYYVADNSPAFTDENQEYQTWKRYFKDFGLMAGYPQICEYSTLLAKNGIIGLSIFLMPLLFVLYKLFSKIISNRMADTSSISNCLVVISLTGMALTGFSNNINITYCYWVILGVAYTCLEKNNTALEV
jgi:hypothetical protein